MQGLEELLSDFQNMLGTFKQTLCQGYTGRHVLQIGEFLILFSVITGKYGGTSVGWISILSAMCWLLLCDAAQAEVYLPSNQLPNSFYLMPPAMLLEQECWIFYVWCIDFHANDQFGGKKKKEVMLHIVYKQQLLKNNDLTNGLRPFFMTSCYKHSSSVICSVLFLIF